METRSAFEEAADQAASIVAIVVAVLLAAAAYLVGQRWLGSTVSPFRVVPAMYAIAVVAGLQLAYLLHVRARVVGRPRLEWMATGIGLAALAAGLQAASILGFDVGLDPDGDPTGAAGLYLIWHASLGLFALGGVLVPRRHTIRRGLAVLTGAAIVTSVLDPAMLPLPRLVAPDGSFTAMHQTTLASVGILSGFAALVWVVRCGRRPSTPESWVAVALALAVLDTVLAAGAGGYFEAIWWSSAVLRAAQFGLPAAGMLADSSRLLTRLRRHEAGLAARAEDELARATAQRDGNGHRVDPGMHERIRAVLDDGSFGVAFQPIYSLSTGRLLGVEALTRFDGDPARPPDEWFQEAAAAGLGVDLELAAVTHILEQSASLAADVSLTLNVSPATLVDARLPDLLGAAAHADVIVEVTEHAIVTDYGALDQAIIGLRRRGLRLAVDDAGAGFASLRHIVRLSPDVIKIDQSLTRDLHLDPVRRSLAGCLTVFAAQTSTTLVAEGIEAIEELMVWQELGADAAQGYLLARPGPLPAPVRPDVILQPRHDGVEPERARRDG